MGSYIEPSLQLLLMLVLAVTAGIAFGAITVMIELRRWKAGIISLAVAVGFPLVGGDGIISRMDPTYRDSMIFGALLAIFLVDLPVTGRLEWDFVDRYPRLVQDLATDYTG